LSLDILAVQDQITTKLNELNQDVYEIGVPEDTKIKMGPNGLFLPYIVACYSDMQESATGRGILSSRYNTGTSFCVVECVAPTQRAARQVAGLVRDKLTGFIPVDAGELRLIGGQSYTDTEARGVPKRYIAEVSFIFTVNTVVS
jgi:hypothetical protein